VRWVLCLYSVVYPRVVQFIGGLWDFSARYRHSTVLYLHVICQCKLPLSAITVANIHYLTYQNTWVEL